MEYLLHMYVHMYNSYVRMCTNNICTYTYKVCTVLLDYVRTYIRSHVQCLLANVQYVHRCTVVTRLVVDANPHTVFKG